MPVVVGFFGTSFRRRPKDGDSFGWPLENCRGLLQESPKDFTRWVPVPGLVDLSNRPFVEVGTQESRKHREAFWYRRTFRLEGPKPPLVRLKINKAKWGKKVYVNGQYVGEHWPCFIACVFDITPFVKADGMENELLIAVGADPQQLRSGVANGWDFENIPYIPGIYDSVMVFLSGEVHIVRAQAVPDIDSQLVRFYIVVRATRESTITQVEVRVFEVSSGRLVGQASLPEVQVPAG
jgi:beta-galactosidase